MKISPTPIEGMKIIETNPVSDHRGKFSRFFCADELDSILGDRKIAQINFSMTSQAGAIRGLHYQVSPHAEMKFIRCLKGRVYDVAVDLREHSPTFLQWQAQELAPDTAVMISIPEGCAHGFQTLEENSELLYLHTEFYEKTSEQGIAYNDPALAIAWPLPVTDISERDRSHFFLPQNFKGLSL